MHEFGTPDPMEKPSSYRLRPRSIEIQAILFLKLLRLAYDAAAINPGF
jgi:hypothetical protein